MLPIPAQRKFTNDRTAACSCAYDINDVMYEKALLFFTFNYFFLTNHENSPTLAASLARFRDLP